MATKKSTPKKGHPVAKASGKKPAETPPKEENSTTPEPTAAPAPEPEEDTQEKDLVQILVKVPLAIKEKAQRQADLAFKYGWIESPTLKQLYIWVTNYYLDSGIKAYIEQRNQDKEKAAAQEDKIEHAG